MKNYILILFAAICFMGCDSSDDPEVIANSPTIDLVTFSCGGAGSNISQVVDVTVTIPVAGSVKKLSMFNKNSNEIYYVENPETGKHRLYHHSITGCSSSVPPGTYYFVFTRADGSKLVTEPYPKP